MTSLPLQLVLMSAMFVTLNYKDLILAELQHGNVVCVKTSH